LSFSDPLSAGGGSGTLRPSARLRAEFHQDVVDVNFDGPNFDAQLARYFAV
jgi:hypothetical protein